MNKNERNKCKKRYEQLVLIEQALIFYRDSVKDTKEYKKINKLRRAVSIQRIKLNFKLIS